MALDKTLKFIGENCIDAKMCEEEITVLAAANILERKRERFYYRIICQP